jgi:hypothetical protein
VTADALSKLDVLLVPNVDLGPTLHDLGAEGRQALRAWVRAGGRYVGWQVGADLAVSLGLSSVRMSEAPAASPGALMRLVAPHPDEYAMWDSYYSELMDPNGAGVVAKFPDEMFVSGYAEDADKLAGSAVEAVQQVGAGSTTVFTVEPNFRAFTDGTARLLFDAMLHTPKPLSTSAAPTMTRSGAVLHPAHTPAQHIAYEHRGRT